MPEETTALAVDPNDHALWVLAHRHLFKFDAQTSLILDQDLRQLAGLVDDPNGLALDPYDGSLWVYTKRTLLHLDRQGQLILRADQNFPLRALTVGLDESLWLLTANQLIHMKPDGTVLASQSVNANGRRGEEGDHEDHAEGNGRLALDALAGQLWIAQDSSLLLLNTADPTQAPQTVALPAGHPIRALSLDPYTHTLWIVSRRSLLRIDANGTVLSETALPVGLKDDDEQVRLAFDPISRSLWLGSKRAVARMDVSGNAVVTLPVRDELQDLAAAPFEVLPQLTLIAPLDGLLTNNPKPPFRLGLAGLCNASPCDLGPGYLAGWRIDGLLNSQSLGAVFKIDQKEADYMPSVRLPEGPNAFSATATDLFGHVSNSVKSAFKIDTIPPQIVSVTPADNSTVNDQPVTIQGSLDDPTASIIVENLATLGGEVVDSSPLHFAFKMPLRSGANVFKLIARDPAGNESDFLLHLTLSTLSAAVTNITPGALIDNDRVLVMGNVQGPPNTGVTVNGTVATVYGGRFFANNVPLQAGDNTLAIRATSQDGTTSVQTLNIKSTGVPTVNVDRGASGAIIRTVAGNGQYGFSGDGGTATQAALGGPNGIAMGADGSLYIADTGNHRVRRVTPDGVITTIAGNGTYGSAGEGGAAVQAQLESPVAVAVGADGSVFIADSDQNRVLRVDPQGVLTAIAGDGNYDYYGDGGPATAAALNSPYDVAVGPDGSIYIADTNNYCVRRVKSDGTIETVAGNGTSGFSGDNGPATNAQMSVWAIAFGPDGSLYIADYENSRVRRVDPSGVITTVAGNGNWSYAGDGGPAVQAQMDPSSVVVAADGSLYIADYSNGRIRRVTTDGRIETVAGGTYGYSGDGGPVLQAALDPYIIKLGTNGDLYVLDLDANRVRAFTTRNMDGNFAPLLFRFAVSDDTGSAITRIDADFDGDGAVDFTTTNPNDVIEHYYPGSGAYVARFTVTTADGTVRTSQYAVVLPDIAAMDAMLRGVYSGMLDRLRTRDIDGALTAVTGGMHDKYLSIFTLLQTDLPTIVDQLGTVESGTVGDEMAEYVVVRKNANGQSQAFLMYFLKSEDGVWRIDGM